MQVEEYISAYIKTPHAKDKHYLRNFIIAVEVLKNFIHNK